MIKMANHVLFLAIAAGFIATARAQGCVTGYYQPPGESEPLKHYDCSNLGLTKWPDKIPDDIQSIDFSNNQLQDFPNPRWKPEYFGTNLRFANFSNNQLRWAGIRGMEPFNHAKNIRNLDLSYNNLGNLQGSEINSDFLLHLNLSNNNINVIYGTALATIQALRTLILDNNKISTNKGGVKEAIFVHVSRLEHISLANNDIKWFPKRAFMSHIKLRIIDVSHNRMENLPVDAFSSFPDIEEVHLQGNRISTVTRPVFSRSYPRLWYIDLSQNRLNFIYRNTFDQMPELKHLDVGHNHLSMIPQDTLKLNSNPKVTELYFNNNPWRCTCDESLLTRLATYGGLLNSIIKKQDATICDKPNDARGQLLFRYTLKCAENYHLYPVLYKTDAFVEPLVELPKVIQYGDWVHWTINLNSTDVFAGILPHHCWLTIDPNDQDIGNGDMVLCENGCIIDPTKTTLHNKTVGEWNVIKLSKEVIRWRPMLPSKKIYLKCTVVFCQSFGCVNKPASECDTFFRNSRRKRSLSVEGMDRVVLAHSFYIN